MELFYFYNIEPIILLGDETHEINYTIDDYYKLFVDKLPDIINVQKTQGSIPSKLEKKKYKF